MDKFAGKIAILFLVMSIGLGLVGFSPVMVQAVTNPIDLELGGEGATSWNISNIKPDDDGTKLVELRNVGSQDGFVTIWISDIVSSEGMNPASETGNTIDPGELSDYLLLNLTADGLGSNINLPTTINKLPQSALGTDYIDVIPLKVGDTINLQWAWELPRQADNDVQGDVLSFTLNYLLREMNITGVSPVVTTEGVFTENVIAVSERSKGTITINKDTTGKTEEGKPLSEIWIIELDQKPPPPPENTTVIGQVYALGPEGTAFDRPVTLKLVYEPDAIPAGVNEEDLAIAVWDKNTGRWVEVEGSTADMTSQTASAPLRHFSRYAILAHLPPPQPPRGSGQPPSPPIVSPEVVTPRLLEVDIMGETAAWEMAADGTLKEALRLADPARNFILDIGSGTRVIGADGSGLGRLELAITQEPVAIPDNTVRLSPLYKVTGYTPGLEVTPVIFEPPARLTISYNPKHLPENSLAPFIATFTAERRLVQLEPPPGATVETGKAKALIGQASLFAVIAELAPSPPPLPARFEVSNLTINPKRARLGQPVVISLNIANEGAITGSYEVYLIIDGIVRAIKEVTLAGNSIETISFEVSNLAAGRHPVKLAGLTGEFQIIYTTVTSPARPPIDWLFVDLSILAAIVAGLLVLYLVIQRSQQQHLG